MPTKTPLTVAVHGATGTQGAPVVRRLLRDGHRVRAIARRPDGLPAGCEPFPADALTPGALDRAYDGVDAVVVQLPLVFDDRAFAYAEQVIEALRRSEVRRVAFNAGGPVPDRPIGVPFVDAKTALVQALEDGPCSATIVEPVAGYMENFSGPWSVPLVRDGVVAYPLPADLPVPWLALDDVAEHVASALSNGEPSRMLVSGPRPLTGAETADAFARALGRPMRYDAIDAGAYGDLIRPHLGDHAADGVAAAYAGGSPLPAAPDPARLRTGRTDLQTWASRAFPR